MFPEPPCNLKTFLEQAKSSLLFTECFKKRTILSVRQHMALSPQPMWKPKMYVPTTSKEPNVLAGKSAERKMKRDRTSCDN
jgi:hypothetical protein